MKNMVRSAFIATIFLGSCTAPPEVPGAAGVRSDSTTWFKREDDNSKFIERYNSLHDSGGVPKDTAVIYTDTWSGQAQYDFSGADSTTATPDR